MSGWELRKHVNAFYEKNIWPKTLGAPPGSPHTCLPAQFHNWLPERNEHPKLRIRGVVMPIDEVVIWHVIYMFRNSMPWPEKWGVEPGTPGCQLPQRFHDAALAPYTETEL